MKIIKLDAVNSTNDFLKELALNQSLENFTVVQANFQTKGRGQRCNKWHSKDGKNLLFSVLVKHKDLHVSDAFALNMVASLAVFSVLNTILSDIKIKWANDIMASNEKIAGILVENRIQKNKIVQSVFGFGINVNQLVFPAYLLKVTSLKLQTNKTYDLDVLLSRFLRVLKKEVLILENNDFSILRDRYLKELYLLNTMSSFKSNEKIFKGKIKGISNQGKLLVAIKNDSVKEFEIKEIEFL